MINVRMRVYLTDEGDRLFNVLPEIALQNCALCTAGLSAEEVQFMTRVLATLITNLTARETV